MSETLVIPDGLEEAVQEAAAQADGYDPSSECEDLNEDLGDFDEGTHPWRGWTWGYHLETRCTYGQTLESPAEYEAFGHVWIDYDGKTVVDWKASQLW
jgi:hypothetical protein